jgi:hypothetical protein
MMELNIVDGLLRTFKNYLRGFQQICKKLDDGYAIYLI